MMPLALILRGMGADVAGSDRSRDQGRSPEKFAWLEALGFTLFPQDGSGVTSPDQILVASAAIEDTVPEIVRARELGCQGMSRAELLAGLFNARARGIAIGGTSGKSTVTGMIGWTLFHAGLDPTVMNGAVMKNFVVPGTPFASAIVGKSELFTSEVDESDGSIALYRPHVGVLLNISHDHKSMEELRALFREFLGCSAIRVVNFDDLEARTICERLKGPAGSLVSYGIDCHDATFGIEPGTIHETAAGISAILVDRRSDQGHGLRLKVPGRHNLSNALAAVAAASAVGVPVNQAVHALASFTGLARRFDVIGTSPSGITVIDDFGHNPDKCAATLSTLKSRPGRVIAFFQPHGYGPLRQMGNKLAETFARLLAADDMTIMCDPVYFGGTVDRSEGSERIVDLIRAHGGSAEYIADRAACADRIVSLARAGDRIVVMGARDDTLSQFAASILDRVS